jgi:hypothetical protein
MARLTLKTAGVGLGPFREPQSKRKVDCKVYACPREDCQAPPGHSCRRYSAGLVGGKDIGGGQWRYYKHPHPERKALVK